MEEAVRELTEGNSTTATQQADLAGQSLLSAILHALNRHWSRVLRLLLGVIAKALQEAFASQVKEAFTAIASEPAEPVEEKAESLRDQLEEKAEDLRRRLAETRDTMQNRLAEAGDQLQERVEGGGSSAGKNGTRGGSQLGRPPSRVAHRLVRQAHGRLKKLQEDARPRFPGKSMCLAGSSISMATCNHQDDMEGGRPVGLPEEV